MMEVNMKMSTQLLMSIALLALFGISLSAQEVPAEDSVIIKTDFKNRADNYFQQERTVIGGYGEMIYTNEEDKPANIEFLRFIVYVDHYFNKWISFKSEIELEHGTELGLEQAYFDFSVRPDFGLRAGLLLIPMSPLNLYHEPTYFHTVSRPRTNNTIVPTTWREFGIGFFGKHESGLKYQAYVTAGLNSEGFKGSSSIRSGRQGSGKIENGAEEGKFKASFKNPAFSARLDYATPVQGLELGAALYWGNSNNRRVDGLDVGGTVTVISANVRYQYENLELRGLYAANRVGDADSINAANGLAGTNSGVGKKAHGFYVSAAYNLMAHLDPETDQQILPFVFFEKTNTHASVPGNIVRNKTYDITNYRFGVDYKPSYNVTLKADVSISKTAAKGAKSHRVVQLGLGYNF